jgi:hypothetical protein
MKKAIFTLILLLGAFDISTQTSDCDSLIIQIETMAERHAKNGENMKTELIIEIYKNNSCGFSQSQLIETYETHYELAKKESSNIWNNFNWLYSVLFFLWVILHKRIEKKIEEIYKNTASSIYLKYSGNIIFRRKALKKYKKSLFRNYEKIKITFRPDKPLNMADIFIPLEVIDNTENNQLKIEKAISQCKKAVVLGDPGSGKSMFCKNILFKYAKDQSKSGRVPILVELHRLSDNSLAIFALLEKELTNNGFPNSSKFITQCLKSGKLFILFDGYDEINSKERSRVTLLINDFIKQYNKCQYVITSRIAAYKDEFKDVTDKTLKLIDFDQQQIRKFLDSWSAEMPEGKSIEQLMQILQDRPKILLLATNPLMLTIVAYLYTDTPHILPHSRGEFYNVATTVLLSPKQGYTDKYDSRDKSLILQHLALVSLEKGQDEQQNRKLIHFTKVFEEIKKILPKINRPETDIQAILEEIVERSGLLLTVDNGDYYQFAHLTMQEYFAAKQLIDKQNELLSKFENDKQTWRETIKLWCGLANDTTEMISKLYEIDPVIAFECIADARSIEPEVADRIITHFEELLLDPDKCNSEIEKAFGILASDVRQRGQDILEKLKRLMELSKENEQIVNVANALSYTYLPKSAAIIATYCLKNKELYNCLIRMGDIAIDELLKLARKNDLDALLAIKQISTPRATLALLSLLAGNKEINRYAAWFLADLLFISTNVTNALRESKLTFRISDNEWIWQPIKAIEPLNSKLPFIIDRIVYLISLPIEFKQKIDLKIDGMIAIPVIIAQNPFYKKWRKDDIYELGLFKKELEWMEKEFLTYYKDGFSLFDLVKDIRFNKINIIFRKQSSFLLKFIDKKTYPIFFMISNSLQSKIFDVLSYNSSFGSKLDWVNLFRTSIKKGYTFNTSWHYCIILILFIILTLSSIAFCVYSIWNHEHFFLWNIVQGIGVLIITYSIISYTFFRIGGMNKLYENSELLSANILGFLFAPIILFAMGIRDDDILSFARNLAMIIWIPFLFYYNYLLLEFFFSTIIILMIAITIIVFCILLAIIGNKLERRVNNPLKGLKKLLLANIKNDYDQRGY